MLFGCANSREGYTVLIKEGSSRDLQVKSARSDTYKYLDVGTPLRSMTMHLEDPCQHGCVSAGVGYSPHLIGTWSIF